MRHKSNPFVPPRGIPKKHQPKVLIFNLEGARIIKTSDPEIVAQIRQSLGENCLVIKSR